MHSSFFEGVGSSSAIRTGKCRDIITDISPKPLPAAAFENLKAAIKNTYKRTYIHKRQTGERLKPCWNFSEAGAVPHVQTNLLFAFALILIWTVHIPLLTYWYGLFIFRNLNAEMLHLSDSRFKFRLFHPAAFVLKLLRHKSNMEVLIRPVLPDIWKTTTLNVYIPRPLVLIIRTLLTFRLLMSYIYIWSTYSWCF